MATAGQNYQAKDASSGVETEPEPRTSEADTQERPRRKFRSSWNAKEANNASAPADYLSNLGQAQDYNINVTHGQNSQHLDSLFTGNFLGHQSDIADGTLRDWESRSYSNIVGDYYIAPAFLDAVTLHIAKNYLTEQFDAQTKVPLILGIWGGKGQGKTFQTELAFKKLGVQPIVMSAGELEDEWAGKPGRLIRERYRRAADISRIQGKLSCLVIHDIDAGIGRYANTQVTVNNQMVVGTLMNICDDPTRVSIGQNWRGSDVIRRTPIIVTGNDFSKVFAPLIRDGRMSKFFWQPTREDLVNILFQMYKDDGLRLDDMAALLDAFPAQPLDFYGALRSATYDNQIRAWIRDDVVKADLADEDANMGELGRRLINREGLPTFLPQQLTLDMLMAEGARLAKEQDHVNAWKLSEDYMKDTNKGGGGGLIGLQG
ncbi:hypothetical protein WJX72_005740 [[Myrmecia] bisecta]|uniref:Ribulose bisphosphate carboxylase/oxygenase activase, chloroplastic n=1 Tax=[Myrmecia] bisecta TaxID=41462 RepID=A0AAW1R6I7_9CHLO